jgi:hypothetical protein
MIAIAGNVEHPKEPSWSEDATQVATRTKKKMTYMTIRSMMLVACHRIFPGDGQLRTCPNTNAGAARPRSAVSAKFFRIAIPRSLS